MRKLSFIFATLVIASNSWAQQEIAPVNIQAIDQEQLNYKPIYRSNSFYKSDSVHNGKLTQNEAIYHFDLINLMAGDSNAIVHFSIDSTEYWRPMKAGRLSVKTTPGTHLFQIYVNDNYFEAISPVLEISSQTELIYQVMLQQPQRPIRAVSYKPVIYLYPAEETEISVQVNIHNGTNPFFYPSYQEEWNCTANPNGDLTIHGEQYRYLFWEAEQNDHLQEIEVDEGFSVAGMDAISFLEEQLSQFGLTSTEQADFITFWGPKLAQNEHNLVRFEWNETCDKFADLNISPTPDHIQRIYIFVAPLNAQINIQPQVIPQMDRNGFTVIEWGGQMSTYQPNNTL